MQQPYEKLQTGALVLVIGSSAPIIRYFSTSLKFSGYVAKGCQYGPGTLEVAREAQPNLILLELGDIHDQDFIFFQKLREAMPQTCPILVLSEHVHNQLIQKLNAAAIIQIPCDIDVVLSQVNSFIGHLNPSLTQERKGFLYRRDSPPPDLPPELRS